MTDNPYERRGHEPPFLGGGAMEIAGRVPMETTMTLADLDAAVEHACERAFREGRARQAQRHHDELREAQRRAWDEGRMAALEGLDRAVGPRVRGVLETARNALSEEKPSIPLLKGTLELAEQALEAVIEAHHKAVGDG